MPPDSGGYKSIPTSHAAAPAAIVARIRGILISPLSLRGVTLPDGGAGGRLGVLEGRLLGGLLFMAAPPYGL